MKLETFFEKFDQLSDAPGSVAKMRELVLELAVHGKLVSQEHSEEPASMQLSRIASAKTNRRRVSRGYAGRTTTSKPTDSSTPVPQGWAAVPLEDLVTILNGRAYAKHELLNSGTPVLRVGNLFTSRDWYYSDLELEPDKYCDCGDLIFAWSASFGPFVWKGPKVIFHYHIWKLELHSQADLSKDYLYLFLQSKTQEIKRAGHGVSMLHMTKEKMEQLEVLLPPFAEQVRIVEKVGELMALCDRLESQQKERETRHAALARAAIARFDEAPTPANLNFLFYPSYTVTPADLRKTILNLAVQGKLVSQDPNDQSVDELLAMSDRQRQETAKSDRRASTDVMSLLSADDRWDVPDNWSWRALADLVLFIDYRGKTPNKVSSGIRLITAKNVRKGELNLSPEEFLSELDYRAWMTRGLPVRGDVLFTTEAPMGNVAVVELAERFGLAQRVICFRSYGSLDPSFLVLQILSESFQLILDKNATGMTAKGIKAGKLKLLPVAVPPLAEQRRIVAKVGLLMHIVDQLENQLRALRMFSRELLDAVVHELLHPAAEVVEFPLSESNRASQRAAIGCYAIEHLTRNPSFGRVMLMKACYLSETHLGLPLGWQPMRQAAGPWDPWVQDFESLGTRSNWFTVTEKTLNNGRSKIEYSPQKALETKADEAVIVLGSQKVEFDRLLSLFADKNTEEVEIITTLFAAWNDFLIDGRKPTDNEIIHEVREKWHQSKERFAPALLLRWLDWMRSHVLIPKGRGPRTRQQLTLRLK